MRKGSQRRGPTLALAEAEPQASHGWRKDAIAAALAAAALIAVVANAAFLQPGPHPAPMFGDKPAPAAPVRKSIRVVGQEFTGPPLPVAAH